MEAQPLKKSIYDKAKEFGIEKIHLNFSGGSDEGYLSVYCEPYKRENNYSDFNSEIEDWAWEVYDYSGAGEGQDYGDDICYDIENGRVTTSEWFTQRQEGESENDQLEIAADE